MCVYMYKRSLLPAKIIEFKLSMEDQTNVCIYVFLEDQTKDIILSHKSLIKLQEAYIFEVYDHDFIG